MAGNQAKDSPGKYFCPICGLRLAKAPYVNGRGSFDSCPCCGFEYGWKDGLGQETHESWRRKWVAAGANWPNQRGDEPAGWDPATQLQNIGIDLDKLREELSRST
jgi:hypothetical protein